MWFKVRKIKKTVSFFFFIFLNFRVNVIKETLEEVSHSRRISSLKHNEISASTSSKKKKVLIKFIRLDRHVCVFGGTFSIISSYHDMIKHTCGMLNVVENCNQIKVNRTESGTGKTILELSHYEYLSIICFIYTNTCICMEAKERLEINFQKTMHGIKHVWLV